MTVFDTAKNITPPATPEVENTYETGKAEYSRKTERDNFKIIHVTQSRMDKIVEFYIHASSLDRMRLEHQLEILKERTEH